MSLVDRGRARVADLTPLSEGWRSGLDMACVGCLLVGEERWGKPARANDPWALHARWRRPTPLGILSAGVLGVRNYALPLSTVLPLDGELDGAALASSGTSTFLPGSRWSLTAAIEKTLFMRPGGTSIGVKADLFVPLKTPENAAGDARLDALSSTTGRVGVLVGW